MHFSCAECRRHHDKLSAGCAVKVVFGVRTRRNLFRNNRQAGQVPQSAQTSRFGAHIARSYLSSIALGAGLHAVF